MEQRYWVQRLHLKPHPTRKISLAKYVEDNYIPEGLHNASLTEQEQEIVDHLRRSSATLQQYQCHHRELREMHLELLAEAIMLDRYPALSSQTAQPIQAVRQQHQ
jgi:hypothetical protein